MTTRVHRRPSLENADRFHGDCNLGTERQRAENWDDRVEEPAVLTSHGCLLAVVGARVAAGQALFEQSDEA